MPYNSQWGRRSPFSDAAVEQHPFLNGDGVANGYGGTLDLESRRLATVSTVTRANVRINAGEGAWTDPPDATAYTTGGASCCRRAARRT